MGNVNYKDFIPGITGRLREAIEWSAIRNYNATDMENPRVLLIGDSICNGYHGDVREILGDKVNVSLWSTSKCVTDKDYLRELDFILDSYPFSMIAFNNGLHSWTTPDAEWEKFYRSAIRFIRAKCPDAKLSIVFATPLKDPARTERAKLLNGIAARIAQDENLPVVDLFALMDPEDRETFWADTYHFRPEGIALQAKLLSEHILSRLDLRNVQGTLCQESTETGPSGALR